MPFFISVTLTFPPRVVFLPFASCTGALPIRLENAVHRDLMIQYR